MTTTPCLPPAFDFGLILGRGQEQNPLTYRPGAKNRSRQFRLLTSASEDAVRRALGFDGESFPCPLPGHHGTAVLEPRARPGHEFVCDCLGRSAAWYHDGAWRSDYARPLADVYASVRAGHVIERGSKLSRGERFVWSLLLAHKVGVIEPAAVAMTPLPPGAPEVHRWTWEFFRLLAGLRLAGMQSGDALPMPFADRLVASYLGVDRKVARAAINALRAHHVIEVVDRMGERGPYLFAPCLSYDNEEER